MAIDKVYFTHGWMVIVHCCIILHQVNTLSSRLNMNYSCTSKYFLTNQIEKTTTKIITKMLMISDFKILSLWFVIEYWWYNTLTRENNWFLNVLVKSNFATPTPFGRVPFLVVGICLSNYNLNSFLIHQAFYSKGYQWYLMHSEVLGSIWKIGRYPIKVSEVLLGRTISFTLRHLEIRKHFLKYHSPRVPAKAFACIWVTIFYTLYGSGLLAQGGGKMFSSPKTQGLSP